jgi:hypothetical protein
MAGGSKKSLGTHAIIDITTTTTTTKKKTARHVVSVDAPPLVKRESGIRRQVESDHAAMVEIVQNDEKLADQALQQKLAKRKKHKKSQK